jgi:hypothetical protein
VDLGFSIFRLTCDMSSLSGTDSRTCGVDSGFSILRLILDGSDDKQKASSSALAEFSSV